MTNSRRAETNPGNTSLRTTILFCLLLLLAASLLLVRNTLPAVQKNRALLREYRNLLVEKSRLEQELVEVKLLHRALLTDPIAVQREALLQRGYTPHRRDVLVR